MIKFIDFYADWCGPCKIMTPLVEEIESEFEGKVEFEKVDVEAQGEKAAKFGIMSIPTFVIVEGDKEIDRKIGAMPKETLRDWINSNV
mgnify:CR=1 FL=1